MNVLDDLSPFIYGHIVSNETFTNREEERILLSKNLRSGKNTMLISPRRWGKSSLVERTLLEIQENYPQYKIIQMDVFSCKSEEIFLERLAREVLKASSNKWQDWIETAKEVFKKIVPNFSLGLDPQNDFTFSLEWKDNQESAIEILNLAEEIAILKKCKFIICMDEFQEISNYEGYENFEKMLRAVWQKHKHVTYCLYGSKRTLMNVMFNKQSKPFYKFGDILMLQKIKTEKWIPYITSQFKKGNKTISEAQCLKIVELMDNHPSYIQQLCDKIWNRTKQIVQDSSIAPAIEEVLYANLPLFEKEMEAVSSYQVNMLKAILKGETKLTSLQVMIDYRLGTNGTVTKNKKQFIEKDILELVNGSYHFLDPVFKYYFQKVFMRA